MAPIPPASLSSSNILPRSAQRATSLARSTTVALSNSILGLIRRQSNNAAIIPTTYGSINSGPSPGTVVGIVLGSVAGFLLLLWLIYTCFSFGTVGTRSTYTESVAVRDRRKSRGSQRSQRSRRVSETVEVRRDRTPVRIVRESSTIRVPVERVERVIVEESRETRRERERSLDSGEVVVIEEHDSPPRRKKSTRREDDRRESGYRTVDPVTYGGVVGGKTGRR